MKDLSKVTTNEQLEGLLIAMLKERRIGMEDDIRAIGNLGHLWDAIVAAALDPVLEILASIEHDQWTAWAKTLLEKEPGISEERKRRWPTLFIPYEQLSEVDKEHDRVWARKVLAVLKASV